MEFGVETANPMLTNGGYPNNNRGGGHGGGGGDEQDDDVEEVDGESVIYSCPICFKVFVELRLLEKHQVQQHNNNHNSSASNKKIISNQQHQQVLTDEIQEIPPPPEIVEVEEVEGNYFEYQFSPLNCDIQVEEFILGGIEEPTTTTTYNNNTENTFIHEIQTPTPSSSRPNNNNNNEKRKKLANDDDEQPFVIHQQVYQEEEIVETETRQERNPEQIKQNNPAKPSIINKEIVKSVPSPPPQIKQQQQQQITPQKSGPIVLKFGQASSPIKRCTTPLFKTNINKKNTPPKRIVFRPPPPRPTPPRPPPPAALQQQQQKTQVIVVQSSSSSSSSSSTTSATAQSSSNNNNISNQVSKNTNNNKDTVVSSLKNEVKKDTRPSTSNNDPVIDPRTLDKINLLKLVRKRVIRICLEDIGLTIRKRCEFCKENVQIAKLSHHQQTQHPDELLEKQRQSIRQRIDSTRTRRVTKPVVVVIEKAKGLPNNNKSSSSSSRRASTTVNSIYSFGSDIYKKQYNNNSPVKSAAAVRRRYQCSYCDKSFVAINQCKSHENTHLVNKQSNKQLVKKEQPPPPQIDIKPKLSTTLEQSPLDLPFPIEQDFKPIQGVTLGPGPHLKLSGNNNSVVDSLENMKENIATSMTLSRGRPPHPPPPPSVSSSTPKTPRPRKTPSRFKPETDSKDSIVLGPDLDPSAKETCQTCGEELPLSIFISHIYSHLHKTQRDCSLCDHTAHAAHELRDHISSIHYRLKPHICSICFAGFAWKSGLKGHETSCHLNSTKPFKCFGCKLRFGTNRERRRHELVHKNINRPPPNVVGESSDLFQGQGQQQQQRVKRTNSYYDESKNEVLRTKQNVGQTMKRKYNNNNKLLSSSSSYGASPHSNNGIMSKLASPEINSILENYVNDSYHEMERVIELDPMTEDYSFMSTLLTKPVPLEQFGGERDSIVAFAMTSAPSSGPAPPPPPSDPSNSTANNYGSWPPNPNVNNNNTYTNQNQNHVMVPPQQTQQTMMMPPPNTMSMAMAPPVGGSIPAGETSRNMNAGRTSAAMQRQQQQNLLNSQNLNAIVSGAVPLPDNIIEDDDMLDELDEDDEADDDGDEYYREEDKKYVEPPDNRVSETCKTCGLLISMSQLKEHIQSHTIKGQLECSICNYKAFNSKYLLDHLNIHYSLKPYECDVCGRHFTFHGYLRSHIKQVHSKSKERPHECRFCDKKFVRPCHRRAHEKVHKGELPKSKRPPSNNSSSSNPTPPITTTPIPVPVPAQPPLQNHVPQVNHPPSPMKGGYKTPTKQQLMNSIDLSTAEMLLSSPANIQPKMTSTWPPMNPQYQDPWLNPIHSELPLPPSPSQQQHQQLQYPHQHPGNYNYNSSSPSSTLAAASNSPSVDPGGGLYFNYQQQPPQINNPHMYQHSTDPKLYQSPASTYQQQQQPQTFAFGSSSFSQTPPHPSQQQLLRPPQQQLQPNPSWPPQQQRAPSSSNNTTQVQVTSFNPNSVFPPSASSSPSSYYFDSTSTNSYEYNNLGSSVSTTIYATNIANNIPIQSAPLPPQLPHQQQQLINNSSNLFNNAVMPAAPSGQPSTSSSSAYNELPDFVLNSQTSFDSSLPGGMLPLNPITQQPSSSSTYSISTPPSNSMSSTFDLWAELRDEELKLFPETSNIMYNASSDPFLNNGPASSLSLQDKQLVEEFASQNLFYGLEQYNLSLSNTSNANANSNNSNSSSLYGSDPFMSMPPLTQQQQQGPLPSLFDPSVYVQQQQQNHPTQSEFMPLVTSSSSSRPSQNPSDPSRIKVKIKRANAQSILVSSNHHQPKQTQIKSEPMPVPLTPTPSSINTHTHTSTSPSTSREIIPTGGRRLSSDDLDDFELTNSQCLICDAILTNSGGFDILEHISSHLSRGQTHCVICDRSFAHSWYLKVHTYKHYGIKLYECTYCHRKFSKRHSLTAHIEQTHDEECIINYSQVCEYCQKSYTSRIALRRHQKVNHGIVLKREVGSKRLNSSQGLNHNNNDNDAYRIYNGPPIRFYKPAHVLQQTHVQQTNKTPTKKNAPAVYLDDDGKELELRIKECHLPIFQRSWMVRLKDIGLQNTTCPICKKSIHVKDMLSHKVDHTEECHICGKIVPATELISHGSTHVSSLYCEICNWKGKQKSQIWEHMNGHLGHKPLKCEYCGVGFASRSSVRLHTIARHTKIRLHKCDFCDARFVTPQVKRMHQLQHYDTNCPFCNKKFELKKELAIHIRVHYKMAGQKLVLKDSIEEYEEEESLLTNEESSTTTLGGGGNESEGGTSLTSESLTSFVGGFGIGSCGDGVGGFSGGVEGNSSNSVEVWSQEPPDFDFNNFNFML